MAIGLGRMFGFHFLENFNYPYISASISEFWNRWHMSLGRWFKDYVYIPLGGNRKGRLIWIRNISAVWLLTGFWHGASWNFILWGMFLGFFIILEKLFLLHWLSKLPKPIGNLYVLSVIVMSFVIFNNDTISSLGNYLSGMFGLLDIPGHSRTSLYLIKSYAFIFAVAIIGSTPFVTHLASRLYAIKKHRQPALYIPILHVTLLLVITGYLVDSSFNPFLYFRF